MTRMPKLIVLTALGGLLLTLLPGCAEEDVGIPCTVGTINEEIPIQLNEQAMECRSRLCIYIKAASAQSLCTGICKDNDDCPGEGEMDTCPEGFTCQFGTSVGGLSCCKMCVCEKYWTKGTIDSSCNEKLSKGFSPTCPEL